MSTAAHPRVAVLGAALDLGQGRRGVDMGPSAIRYAGLVGRLAELGVGVRDLGTVAEDPIEGLAEGDAHAKYLDQILNVCGEIADHVAARCEAGELPLVLGGDHSIALGVFGGLARVHGPVGDDLARRPRRLQHARDDPVGQRPRHGPERRARLGRGAVLGAAAGRRRRSTRSAPC